MRKEEPSNNVKLAATNALLNSLEFTKANFDKEVSACLFLVRTLLLGRPLLGGVQPVWCFSFSGPNAVATSPIKDSNYDIQVEKRRRGTKEEVVLF